MILARYLLGIVGALLILIVAVELLRRGKLRERHTFWWLIAGTLSLVIAIFPSILDALAAALGIDVPVNLLFFVGIVVLFLVCIQQSTELTRSEERTRTLAERVALLEDRLRQVESRTTPPDSDDHG
ncbi:DUF2304 domain-containing protein [Microbacterium sp. Leaf320]|uniref:DUF2304 domain-containing protein n=1 Tax=Microbacterium sp. Leaf320 TaxID=1736334 RepID=UPI0006FC394E|nr:DUF2304 domain-containing protein [Microbacterium sp. Leaf320]KQQ69314.1 hypothetical protein ASF63_02095 [Microbacterium sp. Leaf320]